MKLFGWDTVLCLSPHPDDVEYSMSGTILKYQDTKFHVLILTNGTDSDPTSGAERVEEVRNFWKETGAGNVQLRFVSRGLYDPVGKVLDVIEQGWDFSTYSAVFGPSSDDSHIEHRLVADLVPALCRHHAASMIEYRCSSTLPLWIPNWFEEISVQPKIQALQKAFDSQTDARYFSTDPLEMFHRDFIAEKKGMGPCEQFKILTHYNR